LSAGSAEEEATPRALAAHLAFDVAWLEAMEPVTGPAGSARVRRQEPVFETPSHCPALSPRLRPPDERAAREAAPTPPAAVVDILERRPIRALTRWALGAMAAVVLIAVLVVGFGAHRDDMPGDAVAAIIARREFEVQVGPLSNRESALRLQRRLQRWWPAAFVRFETGRYWIQVTTAAEPFQARASARRLRAEGFRVRTVLQDRQGGGGWQ
jgi:hypothetical protein